MDWMRRRRHEHETATPEPCSAHPEKVRRARMFRQAPTSAEAVLWQGLRRRFVAGLRFRRQHVIAGYVVDFYCPALRLAIELDGGVHETQRERDEQRTIHLSRLGTRVLRIPNARVLSDVVGVLAHVVEVSERLLAGLELDR
jgi:very-short-patch-repair endonuclease